MKRGVGVAYSVNAIAPATSRARLDFCALACDTVAASSVADGPLSRVSVNECCRRVADGLERERYSNN